MISFPKKLITVTAGATLSLTAVITNSPTALSVTLESATLGSFSDTGAGYPVTTSLYSGWRFQINETFQVKNIGGHFAPNKPRPEIFGVIAPLSDLTAFPQGLPRDLEQVSLASTTFSVDSDSTTTRVFLTPLSVTLSPGYYALIFGSGLFGASGFTSMPFPGDQQDFPNSSYFDGFNSPNLELASTWSNREYGNTYFVVEGEPISSTPVPEPNSAFCLLALGILRTASMLRRR